MQLYSRITGEGPPVLVLHGLFGMSDNWIGVGTVLSGLGFSVHLLDLRNHGNSPHTETHRYPDMCDDLLLYLGQHNLSRATIVGHSMGGKLAMIFGLLEPEKVEKLAIIDIAPASYQNSSEMEQHEKIINIMLETDPADFKSRGAIREELTEQLGNPVLAAFLIKNITRDKQAGKLGWKPNLPVLKKFLAHLHIGLEELEIYAPSLIPSLFIRGANSPFYLPQHDDDRSLFFDNSKVVSIDGAGHWVHSEQPDRFLEILGPFLKQSTR